MAALNLEREGDEHKGSGGWVEVPPGGNQPLSLLFGSSFVTLFPRFPARLRTFTLPNGVLSFPVSQLRTQKRLKVKVVHLLSELVVCVCVCVLVANPNPTLTLQISCDWL